MTLPATDTTVVDQLTAIAGAANVVPWDQLTATQQAPWQAGLVPDGVPQGIVTPETAADLAAVMTVLAQHQQRVVPFGAGSKLGWGGLVSDVDWGLSTAKLNRLVEHAVGDLTVTVEAGMPYAELQRILGAAGQFLAIDPAFPATATIGGVVATADAGSLRQRYNSVRDMLIGVSLVRADGQTAKAGGRVVKNVAGYDLMKLLTGSYGTLAVITQLTVRVYPLPPDSRTVVLTGLPETIRSTAQKILQSGLTPTALDVISPAVSDRLGFGERPSLLVRFQTIAPSVEQQVAAAQRTGQLDGLAAQVLAGDAETRLWDQLRDEMTQVPAPTAITAKIGVLPTHVTDLLRTLTELDCDSRLQLHLGKGLGRLVLTGTTAGAAVLTVRSRCVAHAGFLSILHAPPALKQEIDVWGDLGTARPLMQRLKQQFDPQQRLSPGRFL